jgi:hypothetical protein
MNWFSYFCKQKSVEILIKEMVQIHIPFDF